MQKIESLKKIIQTHSCFDFLNSCNQDRFPLLVEGLSDSAKACLLSVLVTRLNQQIIVVSHDKRGQLFQNLCFFLDQEPVEFTADLQAHSLNMDLIASRKNALQRFYHKQTTVLITQLTAFLEKLPAPRHVDADSMLISVQAKVPFDLLIELLISYGYKKRSVVVDKGEFAIRGGLIDLFAINCPEPYRLEFSDQCMVSIRSFNPITQLSIRKLEQFTLLSTHACTQQLEHSLLDYSDQPIVVLDDPFDLEEKFADLATTLRTSHRFFSMEEMFNRLKSLPLVYCVPTALEELSQVSYHTTQKEYQLLSFELFLLTHQAYRWRNPFLSVSQLFPILQDPQELWKACALYQGKMFFLYQSSKEKEEIQEKMADSSAICIQGYLSEGFALQQPDILILPRTEWTHHYQLRRHQQRIHHHGSAPEFTHLSAGETVVHMKNGIGRYLGTEKKENHLGMVVEYMVVEYAQGSKLYIPLEQSHQLTKYIGTDEQLPTLDQLGSSRWERVKLKTQQAIVGYAQELLKLQAQRSVQQGYEYPADSTLVNQFEEEFPYQETQDQLKALEDIKQDMCSKKVMDRLLCGDVGYGKTEVAMRAAFKAIVDGGKQVVVLAPTTLLVLQHYETIRDRMEHFGIRVAVVSRFISTQQHKKLIEDLAQGHIDLVVSTHKILNQTYTFKNLGLLIIDEEQRFGVKVKEYLKKLKADVDCLTLSATPIPRTLYLSLVGARQMSLINTPPQERLPIESHIVTRTEGLIKQVLLRELARDGQAFIIHNKIETLAQCAGQIQKLVPHAKIACAHGQLPADNLEHIFHRFKEGEIDILVSTSIIENGIDIPNANTILVDRADCFGLADLYQMRGRVGRWNRKSYCYFLVPSVEALPEIARKRLAALAYSGHGAGMRLALRDLEIRGAGNILGTEQSGHVSQIGFQLYCKLLKKAIKALEQQQIPLFLEDVKMEFPIDTRIPESYIEDIDLRIECYQRLAECSTVEEITELTQELTDRFGTLPLSVVWLQAMAQVKLSAIALGCVALIWSKGKLTIEKMDAARKKTSYTIACPLESSPHAFIHKMQQILV